MTVKRPDLTPDAGGDVPKGTLNNVANHIDLPCRRRKLKAAEVPDNGRKKQVSTHRIYCGVSADVTENSIKSRDEIHLSDGSVFEVNTVDDPHDLGHHLEIDVTERKEG